MHRSRGPRLTLLAVLIALVAGPGTALAQPPTPPPNPSDGQLDRSREEVAGRADEVARLTGRLAELDSRTEDLQIELAIRRETAEAALVELESAQAAAVAADERADAARVETAAASDAIDRARARLDGFLTATYLQGIDVGPLGLLSAAESPEDLVARAVYSDAIVREQLAATDALERARVDKANADSAARAALEEARDREAEAEAARLSADTAFADADSAAREHAGLLAGVDRERAEVLAQLDAARASDTGLREQRDRFEAWERRIADEQAARERTDRDAAAARLGTDDRPAVGGAAVSRAIDRAMSQLGVQYVWGGGNGRGPSTGIPGPAGDPGNRIGFDCSGLMLYAFNGVGVSLPRVSRNQFHAGRQVPVSDLRAGDMVFYRRGSAPIHHVALYIGDGRMVEAPYTGANVRVVPLRRANLVPEATRML